MSNEKLKDCPFCGSPYANKPEIKSYYNSRTGKMYFVECTYCFASSEHSKSKATAIKAWNRRKRYD